MPRVWRGRLFPLAMASALAWLGGCGDRPLHPLFKDRRPVIFSHRGGGGLEPEETVETLVDAYQREPTFVVEFDVHRTKDGQLVVNHDATVDRTTEGHGRIADLTLAELKTLDAGYCATPGQGDGTAPEGECRTRPAGDFPFRGRRRRIATLDEVLAALPKEAIISVEEKGAGFERQLATVLRASGRLDRLVVGSEDDDTALRLKDLLPEAAHYLPRGAATCVALASKLRLPHPDCPTYDVFASPLSGAGLALDTKTVLDDAHHRGLVVIYWTINDEAEIERLLRLGADGVFTDYPDRARQALDRLRGPERK